MVKAVIAGVTGYTGQEVLRYLASHPHVEIIGYLSSSQAGKRLSEAGVPVPDHLDLVLEPLDSSTAKNADVLFACLPHGESARFVRRVLGENSTLRVIDLSADFRFSDAKVWEEIYGKAHSAPELCRDAVYGLPEANRDAVKKARIVACPGCYPTAFLISSLPLIRRNLTSEFIFDAKSGISGAGRKAVQENLFAELHDNIRPYNVFRHRHQGEMEYQGKLLGGAEVRVGFFPQVIPASRGILGTVYTRLENDVEEIRSIYADEYCSEHFVRLLPEGTHPQTSDVRGTNMAHIQVYYHRETSTLAVTCAIDNLGKGAAGQAVQNMNLMFDFPETEGLEVLPLKI